MASLAENALAQVTGGVDTHRLDVKAIASCHSPVRDGPTSDRRSTTPSASVGGPTAARSVDPRPDHRRHHSTSRQSVASRSPRTLTTRRRRAPC